MKFENRDDATSPASSFCFFLPQLYRQHCFNLKLKVRLEVKRRRIEIYFQESLCVKGI
ncbi:unnamed protein product [Brassica oleracea var. botrytis]